MQVHNNLPRGETAGLATANTISKRAQQANTNCAYAQTDRQVHNNLTYNCERAQKNTNYVCAGMHAQTDRCTTNNLPRSRCVSWLLVTDVVFFQCRAFLFFFFLGDCDTDGLANSPVCVWVYFDEIYNEMYNEMYNAFRPSALLTLLKVGIVTARDEIWVLFPVTDSLWLLFVFFSDRKLSLWHYRALTRLISTHCTNWSVMVKLLRCRSACAVWHQ